MFDSVKRFFVKGAPPPPDTSAHVKVCGQQIVEEFFSPNQWQRATIYQDEKGIFRIRLYRWCIDDWEAAGAAFWAQVDAMNTMTDTLDNARRIAKEYLANIN
jgi:hypothetical protein